jgi:hypothetical protein
METVFVSYAREDQTQAREIYVHLVKAGFSAWIDKTELVGGENWEVKIRDTISSSRVFLACLSSPSVSKRGYVQAERKQALKVLRPESGRCASDPSHAWQLVAFAERSVARAVRGVHCRQCVR